MNKLTLNEPAITSPSFPEFGVIFPQFPVSSKFPDISLTGKCLPIFPGFPVGTLTSDTSLIEIKGLQPHFRAACREYLKVHLASSQR